MGVVHRLLKDRRAASASEYAILLGIVGSSIAVAALSLSGSIACAMDESAMRVAGQEPHPNHDRGKSDPNGQAKGHNKGC